MILRARTGASPPAPIIVSARYACRSSRCRAAAPNGISRRRSAGAERWVQTGIYGTYLRRAGLFCRLSRRQPIIDVDRSVRAVRRPSHRQIRGANLGGRLEGGYRFGTPLAASRLMRPWNAGFSHTDLLSARADLAGSGFGPAYRDARPPTHGASSARASIARRWSRRFRGASTLRGRAAWAHDWVSDPTLVAAFQALPGASFIVNGASAGKGHRARICRCRAEVFERRCPVGEVRRRVRGAQHHLFRHREPAIRVVAASVSSRRPRADRHDPEAGKMRIEELLDLLAQHLGRHRHHALLQAERDNSMHGGKQRARQQRDPHVVRSR